MCLEADGQSFGVSFGKMKAELTRVSLPVKVVVGVAMALELLSQILASRAVREWNVVVGNVVEEVNFVPVEQKACSNGVDWCVTPALIEEATVTVK